MQISLVNFSGLEDAEVLRVARAINRQIRDDFAPYWSWTATLRLDGSSAQNRASRTRSKRLEQAPPDLRGDAILYLWDRIADAGNAIGYHDKNNRGLPYGFVFTEIAKELGEDWTVTLSHEALELIGDASANTLAAGPHPKARRRTVYHWYEMCDAVQDEHYEIDGVKVSNFVLPLYFTLGEQQGGRNDFLSTETPKGTLRSFGINPGGYIGFQDPATGESHTVAADKRGERRNAIKSQLGDRARRASRYARIDQRARGKVAP